MAAEFRSLNTLLADYFGERHFLVDLGVDEADWKELQWLAAEFITELEIRQKHDRAAAHAHYLGRSWPPILIYKRPMAKCD